MVSRYQPCEALVDFDRPYWREPCTQQGRWRLTVFGTWDEAFACHQHIGDVAWQHGWWSFEAAHVDHEATEDRVLA